MVIVGVAWRGAAWRTILYSVWRAMLASNRLPSFFMKDIGLGWDDFVFRGFVFRNAEPCFSSLWEYWG